MGANKASLGDGRYDRLGLIGWWDQKKLRAGRVMVVGAGAIGNEVIKHFALSGVRNLFVIDMDRIEMSNLSRTVLFSESDEGKKKSVVAARAAERLNPEIRAVGFDGDVRTDLGLGVFRRMDVVVGGVDNLAARIHLNGACWNLGIPYVDGGTLSLLGQVRVIRGPDGPCYECSLGEEDFRRLQERFHCNLLGRSDIEEGKAPTTSIASSIIGAIEAQKAIEILHGLPVPAGKTIVYNGQLAGGEHEIYMAGGSPRDSAWHRHSELQRWENIIELPRSADRLTAGGLLDIARKELGPGVSLELRNNLVTRFRCAPCGSERKAMKPLLKCFGRDAACAKCREPMVPELLYRIDRQSDYADRKLSDLGVPALDIVHVRNESRSVYYELTGDLKSVLGKLLRGN